MKKYIYLLLMLMPVLAFTSCDDDELPDVSVSVVLDGCYRNGNTLYVVQGDDLEVEAVTLINNGDDNAIIGSVGYFWDSFRIGTAVSAPYSFEIDTANAQPGTHLFQFEASVFAVDYEPCEAYISYDVVIVPDEDDIPAEAIPTPTVDASIRVGSTN